MTIQNQQEEIARLKEELAVEQRDHRLTAQRQRADEKIIERLQLENEDLKRQLQRSDIWERQSER